MQWTVICNECKFEAKGRISYARYQNKDLKVVPHNPGILKDSDGHTNVEFCPSHFAAIYLYKYIYKGVSKETMLLRNADDVKNNDKINLYLRSRTMNAMKVYWDLQGHQTYPASYPAVKEIKVKSPSHEQIFYEEGKLSVFQTAIK